MYRGIERIRTVGVAGAGTIGAGWAAYFLAKGFKVEVADSAPGAVDRVRRLVDEIWPSFEKANWLVESAQPDALTFHTSFSQLQAVDFVQESVFESLEVKRDALQQLDSILPADVLLSSSTSGLLVTDMQHGMLHPQRILIGHPMNPPHLIPLVEIVGGDATDPLAVQEAARFFNGIGKRAVVLNRPVIGHLATRLTVALWREAAYLVSTGVASLEDVDAAVVYGPGLRSAIAGPHLSYHMGGGDKGLPGFFDWAADPLRAWCDDLGTPVIDEALFTTLIAGVQDAVGETPVAELTAARDKDLLRVLFALSVRSLP